MAVAGVTVPHVDDLPASWARTHAHLTAARSALPPSVTVDSLAASDDYLRHNELGLALDVLADVAEKADADAACWQALLAAVQEMALGQDDEVHGAAVRLVLRRADHHG